MAVEFSGSFSKCENAAQAADAWSVVPLSIIKGLNNREEYALKVLTAWEDAVESIATTEAVSILLNSGVKEHAIVCWFRYYDFEDTSVADACDFLKS